MTTTSTPGIRAIHLPSVAAFLLLAGAVMPSAAFDGYGEWRGQAQFIVTESGHPGPVVQEVVPIAIRIDRDGKVVGTSAENGCRLLGMVSPVGNNVMRLDVTFRDCDDQNLNRRVSGTLALYPADRRLALNVSFLDTSVKPVTKFEVTAPMLRR